MYLMWFVSWKYSLSLESFKSSRPKRVHRYVTSYIHSTNHMFIIDNRGHHLTNHMFIVGNRGHDLTPL